MDWLIIVIGGFGVVGFLILKRLSFIAPAEARRLLVAGATVVDVRSPEEFRGGHVPGAINIPLDELSATISRHLPEKQQPVLVHCLSGGRSAIARQKMKGLGYPQVFNLGSLARARKIAAIASEH